MVSRARKAFDENCKDIDRLLEIHTDKGGTNSGRRYGLEVLNKSAIVHLTAIWEAYCEDIAAEGLDHLVTHCGDWKGLPLELQKSVAADLKNEEHELAIWQLAGEGWKKVLKDRLDYLQMERNWSLNTPKTEKIDLLFRNALAIETISSHWYWKSVRKQQAANKLDHYVALRGAIAHRGAAAKSVELSAVTNYYRHIKHLVGKTDEAVNNAMKKNTGKPLF